MIASVTGGPEETKDRIDSSQSWRAKRKAHVCAQVTSILAGGSSLYLSHSVLFEKGVLLVTSILKICGSDNSPRSRQSSASYMAESPILPRPESNTFSILSKRNWVSNE